MKYNEKPWSKMIILSRGIDCANHVQRMYTCWLDIFLQIQCQNDNFRLLKTGVSDDVFEENYGINKISQKIPPEQIKNHHNLKIFLCLFILLVLSIRNNRKNDQHISETRF